MILRCLKILLLITSLVFTTGFAPIVALVGPATTIIASGNIYKASAQLIIDQSIKKKTVKNSLTLIKEELDKKSQEKSNNNYNFSILDRIDSIKNLNINELKSFT